ncbi:MAG: hypothetical protein RDU24_05770 [Humidesulfovibrio sp.]|uniref:hypothetical protein n=1 Tax=Humidesulfovibrio sp. TaxID=2910988 RepID=UPI0027EE85C1|nr:hypothetical protein [Humidesulfovibrio sp.]MDQ7834870.1 hypothetical protein [Humidesulfovibrio sp.]
MNAGPRFPRCLSFGLAFAGAALALSVALTSPALAEEVRRYKPVVVQGGDNNLYPPKVLIVDTRDGHLWLWQERGKKDSQDGLADTQLIYQGKVAPGRAAGDVISTIKRK